MKIGKVKLIISTVMILALICSTVFMSVTLYNGSNQVQKAIVLKQGNTGDLVRTMQDKLKRWGYYFGGVDGIFGSATRKAVVYFQNTNGLVADGIVGTKTAAAMGLKLGDDKKSSSYSGSDEYLLAKVVYSESRGEPYEGKVAVAAVALNRVSSPDFPNSLAGVVYQPWAFTAVHDGQINLTPDESSKKAARDALNGWDPTNGCIFYYNPKTATSTWIRSKKVIIVIGEHYFCV